jgi:hypothetical protein
LPFVIDHNPTSTEDSMPIASLAPALAQRVEVGADLIEALGSPSPVVKAFERLQKTLLGY